MENEIKIGYEWKFLIADIMGIERYKVSFTNNELFIRYDNIEELKQIVKFMEFLKEVAGDKILIKRIFEKWKK